MADVLDIRVLGELSVRVDGVVQPLPRSRKTRALLGYLAITRRAHRREHLCDLLWDVADDRRAALRWSLSKLRKTLGPDADHHLVATRERVELRLHDDALDWTRLRRAVRGGLERADPGDLEALVRGWNGELLEGMLLPDFEGFEAWLEAERTEARALHHRVRSWLAARVEAAPKAAFEHALAWVQSGGGVPARQRLDALAQRLHDSATASEPPSSTALASDPRAHPPAPQPPLVGRAREVARLTRLARAAREDRRVHLALVTGEPGMGKTRLLEELRYLEGPSAPFECTASFHEVERGRPLSAFVDALPELLSAEPAGATDRELLFERVSTVLRQGADARGLALVLVDDAHLSDASSCELLHFVVRTAARFPLLVVITCRPAELEENPGLRRTLAALRRRSPVEELHLGPLDPQATRALLRLEAREESLDVLIERSAGVPLMALELARAATEGVDLPPSLAELVHARLSNLSDETQALVQWASALEQGPVSLLAQLSGLEGAHGVAAIEQATRYRLIRIEGAPRGPDAFRIGHALVGRVIYESISGVRRQAMHRAIAQALLDSPPTADRTAAIAHHATQAGDPGLAARALLQAADRSAALGGRTEALELVDRALSCLPGLGAAEALQVEVEALALQVQLRRPPDPGRCLDRLTALGRDALRQGRPDLASLAFQTAGHLHWEVGNEESGVGIVRQAHRVGALAGGSDRVRGGSMVALCLLLMEREIAEAHALVHEAQALTEGEEEPCELALARALLHLHGGRLDAARSALDDARTSAAMERHGLREAAAIRLAMQLELLAGQHPRALELAAELHAHAQRIREGPEGPLARAVIGLLEPDPVAMRSQLEPAFECLHRLDDKRAVAWVLNRWSRRERAEGAYDRAAELAERALEAARVVDALGEAALAACELLAVASAREDDRGYAEAERLLAEVESEGNLPYEARLAIWQTTEQTHRPHPTAEAARADAPLPSSPRPRTEPWNS